MDLSNLKLGPEVQTASPDVIRGATSVRDTGLFAAEIDMAYLSKSAAGATSLNLSFREAGKNSSTLLRFTLWIISGDAKGNKNYYINQRGKQEPLPGMALGNDIAIIATGKDLGDLTAEKRIIKLRNWTTGQDEPTEVDCVVDLLGKPVLLGLEKVQENRRVQAPNGSYVDSDEMRTYNDIEKAFFPSGHTITEKRAGADPEFVQRWKTKFNTDYVNNKFKPGTGIPARSGGAASDQLPWGGSADDKAAASNGAAVATPSSESLFT